MTDWTKDDVDEDSKFWNWMEKDKENYNKKYPRKLEKLKNKKKKIIVLGIISVALVVIVFGMLSNENEFGSEKYFYIPDYRLNKSPLICILDFRSFFPWYQHCYDRKDFICHPKLGDGIGKIY